MHPALAALHRGETVVTATLVQARYWLSRFARTQRRNGCAVWRAPDVLTLSAWLERMYADAELGGLLASGLQLLTPTNAREVWRQTLPERSIQASETAAVERALGTWSLLHAHAISLEDAAARASTEDERLFVAWATDFRSRCDTEGWIDHGRWLAQLPVRAQPTTPACLFVGFAGAGRAIVESLQRFGTVVQSGPPPPLASPDLAERCADAGEELNVAGRWLAQHIEQTPDALTAVVLPDGIRIDDLRRRQLRAGLLGSWPDASDAAPPRVADDIRLADQAAFRAAMLLLKLPRGYVDVVELGELLRSPFIAGAVQEESARALLDVRLRERGLRDVVLRDCLHDDAFDAVPTLRGVIEAMLNSADRLSGRLAPASWSTAIDRVLREAGWGHPATARPLPPPLDGAWRGLLDRCAATGLVSGRVDFARARQWLASAAADSDIHWPTTSPTVDLLTVQEADGMAFDALWFAGFTADAWPAAPHFDPLLDGRLQQERGVIAANPEAYRDVQQSALRRVAGDSAQFGVSWPLTIEDVPQAPHAVWANVDWRDAGTAAQPTRVALESLQQDPAPPLAENERVRGGSRVLQLQADCPARAFFERRLGATPLAVVPFGLDAATRGRLVHAALEAAYRRFAESANLTRLDTAALDSIVGDAVQSVFARYSRHRDGFLRVVAAQERQRVVQLVRRFVDLDRVRDAFSIKAIESEADVTIGPLRLKLRHDRIDRLADGRQLVLDYKTSSSVSVAGWLGERPAEPQLPLYAATSGADGIAFVQLHGRRVRVVGVAREAGEFAGIKSAESKPFSSEWEAILIHWRDALTNLADEFAGGDCRIDRRSTALAAGDFAMLTRVVELDRR